MLDDDCVVDVLLLVAVELELEELELLDVLLVGSLAGVVVTVEDFSVLVTLVDVKELVVELDGEELDVGLARLALLLGPTGECFINVCFEMQFPNKS